MPLRSFPLFLVGLVGFVALTILQIVFSCIGVTEAVGFDLIIDGSTSYKVVVYFLAPLAPVGFLFYALYFFAINKKTQLTFVGINFAFLVLSAVLTSCASLCLEKIPDEWDEANMDKRIQYEKDVCVSYFYCNICGLNWIFPCVTMSFICYEYRTIHYIIKQR
ncbi:hypothetical protein EIN_136570 [Entamoeba invadens IP1]|uniref:Uncharacterized protein n=1 Tax=Entamoeba invadens IP1 TaxID=370355 RepID=A0A0A1TXG6_ENTIV|nr:hypothetical protein EIN_136570 [Entamoeba invadens IP1]ELP85983.1 hypothetical protein EIN_136570 [Entamoeba invadens IP1]|eukprot:XP_004185329.1 hypothetical protein EIN_136570 [Entamoeba invadens IP1]